MWQSWLQWQADRHIGDIASVLGLVVSLFGFVVTFYGIFSSRRAALRAELAAKSALQRIKLIDDLVDLSAAIVALEEIRRFQRTEKWDLLPDRYSMIKKTLISVRSANTQLTGEQRTRIQSAIATLQGIERVIEKTLADGKTGSAVRLNNLLAKESDGLLEILLELKLTKADGPDGKAN